MPQAATQPGWLLPWRDDGLAAALAVFRAHGHLVILADAGATALPPPLPQEIEAARRAADASGYLVRRAIARALAGALAGIEPCVVCIGQTPEGAPRLARPDLHLSFAARGAIGVIALGTRPLGVDYEMELTPAGIPWNILRPDERAALESLPEAERTQAFLALWRAKEASLKAVGSGFRRAPESVSVRGGLAFVAGIETPLSLICAPEAGITLARL